MLQKLLTQKPKLVRTNETKSIVPYIKALRPRQWTKNLIVFAAPLFAFNFNGSSITGSLLAFVLFSAASSSFYLLNDIIDVKADRLHPIKCCRPIAAGLVNLKVAKIIALVLLFGAITLGYWRSHSLGIVLILYGLLQIAYNFKLKHTPIFDVFAIATGFVLRAFAGGLATEIHLSVWFVLCTAMLALFLAVEKRKAELRLLQIHGGKTRVVLQRYSLSLLARMESTVTTGTLMSYALWSSGTIVDGASTPWMMLTFPFVLYGIFRYQMLSEPRVKLEEKPRNGQLDAPTERPEEVLLTELPMLLTVTGWAISALTILWLKSQGIIN